MVVIYQLSIFLKTLHLSIILTGMSVSVCVCHGVHVKVRGQCGELVLSFHHMNPTKLAASPLTF